MADTQLPGWYDDPNDPSLVRRWNGSAWTAPMSVEMAQLHELSKLNSKYGELRKIAFRVGFLALLALIGLIASFLIIPLSLIG
jgi:hypothetical protein